MKKWCEEWKGERVDKEAVDNEIMKMKKDI